MPLYQHLGYQKRLHVRIYHPISYEQHRQGIRLALYFIALFLTFVLGLIASK
jgi:hypothetical protein